MKTQYEFFVRQAFKEYVLKNDKLLFVRPGNRFAPNPKGTREGTVAKIKFIAIPGDEIRQIEPILEQNENIEVKIIKMSVKRINQITLEELSLLPDVLNNLEALKCCLGLIYNRIFLNDDEVTLFWLKKQK